MRYYVVWPNGQRFGPADLATLNQWARENRIGPSTTLAEEGTGRTFPANQLPGLDLTPLNPSSFTSQYDPALSPYRVGYGTKSPASTEVFLAWVFGALGLFCCPAFGLAGIVLSAVALQKRQNSAMAALIFCIVTTLIGLFASAFLPSIDFIT